MSKSNIAEQTEALTVNMNADDSVALTGAYNPLVKGLSDLIKTSKSIEVKDIGDVDGMKQARKTRLELRAIRIDVENKRKELKVNVVLKGKAIDGFANIIKNEIVPEENRLQAQEDFIKREQERLAQERDTKRMAEIGEHTDTEYGIGTLGAMSEEVYSQLLSGAKIAKEQAAEAVRKAQEIEDARLEKEAKEKADLIKENKRLADIEKEAEKARKIAEDEKQEQLDIAEALRKKNDAKALKIKQDAQAEIDEANAEAKRLKDEADEKEAQRKQDIADADATRLADIEKAKSAPDAVKLQSILTQLCKLDIPTVESEIASAVVLDVRAKLNDIVKAIRAGVAELKGA